MLEAWRIVKEKYAATAFSGEGAAIAGGRWNSQGVKVIYASKTKSLAALENLVHINPQVLFKYVIFHVEFDESLVHQAFPSDLPKDWHTEPPPPSTQQFGDFWVRSEKSVVIAVPSVIVPGEINFLLNPNHSDFKKISVGKPEPFTFDPRLF
jgi:RES domain-containing protein